MEDLLFVDEMELEIERLVFRENLLYTQSMTKNATTDFVRLFSNKFYKMESF